MPRRCPATAHHAPTSARHDRAGGLPAALLAVLTTLAACTPGPAARPPADGLAASAAEPATPVVLRSERTITLPELTLQRADGTTWPLHRLLFDGRPVVLTFMYSSCTTVCPVTNQTLVTFEALLGARQAEVNTVSVSIDPDHDTVRALAEYARRTGGRGGYFTGDPAASEAVQRAFDAWRGDKMNHPPVFLLNTRPDRPWVRLDGLVSPRQLLDELRRLEAERA